MALKRITKADPNMSMSSMTDIVFLLLIFFLVTSTLPASQEHRAGGRKSHRERLHQGLG